MHPTSIRRQSYWVKLRTVLLSLNNIISSSIAGGARWTPNSWRDYSSNAYIFDVDSEEFTDLSQGLSLARFQMVCGYLQDSQGERDIYFAGGEASHFATPALLLTAIYCM